ncbi:hypothetical protein BVC80_1751g59 [Macleaya cordata]|uniref:Uncharacterized protein n=1 Tax=Macleaya cordata TaxID=56857 RepID=A0A200QHG2_MACCD|nr:hypothetical protein BVC80_1751g59 [Macleaya cordata]
MRSFKGTLAWKLLDRTLGIFGDWRTRAVFDMAITVHRKIQERDLEVGRNIGNWVLRWLDRMKPSAQIRAIAPKQPPSAGNTTKQVPKSDLQQPPRTIQKSDCRSADPKSDGRLFTTSMNMTPKSFPTWMKMMRPSNPTSTNTQYRHLCISMPDIPRINYGIGRYEGVIRKDIMQWMVRN